MHYEDPRAPVLGVALSVTSRVSFGEKCVLKIKFGTWRFVFWHARSEPTSNSVQCHRHMIMNMIVTMSM